MYNCCCYFLCLQTSLRFVLQSFYEPSTEFLELSQEEALFPQCLHLSRLCESHIAYALGASTPCLCYDHNIVIVATVCSFHLIAQCLYLWVHCQSYCSSGWTYFHLVMDHLASVPWLLHILVCGCQAANAQAALAFKLYQEKFSGPRWDALEKRGAKKQRALWASTSVKNPAYPDTLYVNPLIGPDTVSWYSSQETCLKSIERKLAAFKSFWKLHQK